MDAPGIRYRIVRQLWSNGVLEGVDSVNVDTFAEFAVPSDFESRAQQLIEDEMVTDGNCPVVWRVDEETITLEQDREKVAWYISQHGDKEALPWDLRDVAADDKTTSEVADQRG